MAAKIKRDKVIRESTPGPGQYNNRMDYVYPDVRYASISMGRRYGPEPVLDTPGPGAYDYTRRLSVEAPKYT